MMQIDVFKAEQVRRLAEAEAVRRELLVREVVSQERRRRRDVRRLARAEQRVRQLRVRLAAVMARA